MADFITGAFLKNVAPTLDIDRANALADIFNKILPLYGMCNKEVLPEFFAQLAQESHEFSAKTENLNYSAEGILKTWPSRFAILADALPYARNPQKLANKVYNGRMGNALNSDDGWNFRGAGFLQLTGKDCVMPYFQYKQKGKGYQFTERPETPEQLVELLRNRDDWATDSACWEFAICKGLLDEAEENDFVTITKRINGGLLGLSSRQQYYKKALESFA